MPGGAGDSQALGHLVGAGGCAVKDGDVGTAQVDEVADEQLAHLPRADDSDRGAGDVLEKLLGEFDGYAGDANALSGNAGGSVNFLTGGKGAVKKTVEDFVGALSGSGQGVTFLDLGEDLSFAYDHAVQTGGNGE